MKNFSAILIAGVTACLTSWSGAQNAPATPNAQSAPATPAPVQPDFSAVQIKTTRVAGNLYALEGQGGTVTVLPGDDGAVLIDSQFAPLTDKLVAAIRGFSAAPLRFLVNTHVHGDHTGGNANFTRLGATIIAHDNVRQRLRFPAATATGAPGTPAVAAALPVVTFGSTAQLHLNGQRMVLTSLPPAHTDGDILIEFPGLDVMVTGDFFRSVGYPGADFNSGGSFRGLIDALGIAVGRAGPATKVIPGHGPITDRNAIAAQRDVLIAVREKVRELVAQGMTVEQVVAAKPTAAFDGQVAQGAQGAERFVRGLFAELATERR